MKFTQTEAQLLAEAQRNPGGRVGIDYGYQARRAFGARRHAAACSLMKKGLLTFMPELRCTTPLYKPGYGINGRVTTSVFKLTQK